MAEKPYYLLNTFAERQAAREKAEKPTKATTEKSVDNEDVEDKSVASTKTTRKRTAKKG